MDEERANPEPALARLAAEQYGVLSVAQLYELGFTKDEVWKRAQTGRLNRVHRGVYAVGHSGLCNEGRWIAAVLACGSGAVLSHRSAAGLWQLLPPVAQPVHVTSPKAAGRYRDGIHLHRSPSMRRSSRTISNGIAVTTPARTLSDLRGAVDGPTLRRAIRQAEVLGYRLGEVVSDGTHSELEYLFLRLCRRHRLPPPSVNVRLGPFVVDFLWPEQRLIVETDGYRYHRGRLAFEADHARQLALEQLGYRVRRYTYRQVTQAPREVAAAVRKALATSSS